MNLQFKKASNLQNHYIEINLREEFDTQSNKVLSLFEECVFPLCFCENEPPREINTWEDIKTWEDQFNLLMKNNSFINKIRHCYKHFNGLEKEEDRIKMNYQTRLLMRDLFMFFPDIDKGAASFSADHK